jgi:hypothetical protein
MRRPFAFVPAAWLLLACTNAEPPTADPIQRGAPPTAQLESEPNPVSTTDGPEYFFAVASQVGVEHCPKGEFEWLAVQPTLGWVTTSGAAAAELEALMDLPVLARGSVGPKPALPPLAVEPAPCPIMQMRSDWVNTPRGIRVHRTTPTGADHFHSTSVRRLDELKAVVAGEQVTASFENPLPFALTGVRLRMHYEGCYGKPGATSMESEALRLGPGERLEHAFPLLEQKDPKRVHRAAALVLEIAASEGPADAKVWTDLDVSLHRLGVDFECK